MYCCQYMGLHNVLISIVHLSHTQNEIGTKFDKDFHNNVYYAGNQN